MISNLDYDIPVNLSIAEIKSLRNAYLDIFKPYLIRGGGFEF